jgi:hypothetical protein
MKKDIVKISMIFLCSILLLGSCKKKHHDPVATTDSAIQGTTALDQSNYIAASNQSSEEADVIASGSSSTARTTSGGTTVPGMSIDSSNVASGVFYITYSGQSASGIIRTGKDTLIVTGKWHVAGSTIVSKYNYTVTFLSGRTIQLIGTDTITNISGGNYWSLLAGTSITTTHTGTAQLTFDGVTKRTWHHSRQKVRSFANGVITATITGTGNYAGATDVEAVGVNRLGETFYGEITSPLVWSYYANPASNTCSHWADPISGSYFHKGTGSGLTVTFGVSSTGAANTTSDTCPYGYKLDWTFNSKNEELILSY